MAAVGVPIGRACTSPTKSGGFAPGWTRPATYLLATLYRVGGGGVISTDEWTDDRTADIALTDPDGNLVDIPTGVVPLVDPATGRCPRYSGGSYYATDISGNPLSSYGDWIFMHYPAATNLITDSDDPIGWSDTGGGNVSAAISSGDTIAGITATKITTAVGGAAWEGMIPISIAQTGVHTFSLFCAAGSVSSIKLVIQDSTGGQSLATSWTIGDASVTPGTNALCGTVTFLSRETVAGGYRYSFTFTPTTDANTFLYRVGTNTVPSGTDDTIFIARPQLEATDFVTPPIYTSGGTATRDDCVINHPWDGYIDQTEGTLHVQVYFDFDPVGGSTRGVIGPDTLAGYMIYLSSATGAVAGTDKTNYKVFPYHYDYNAGESWNYVMTWASSSAMTFDAREVGTSTWGTQAVSGGNYDGEFAPSPTTLGFANGGKGIYGLSKITIASKAFTSAEIQVKFSQGVVG